MSKAAWWKMVVSKAVGKWHRRENTSKHRNALQKEKTKYPSLIKQTRYLLSHGHISGFILLHFEGNKNAVQMMFWKL